MGNHSVSPDVTRPLGHEWQEQILDARVADSLNFVMLYNPATGQQAQEYLLTLPTDALPDQIHKYNLRHSQLYNLVSVKNVEVVEAGGTCSGNKDRLKVVTQRIVGSLANCGKLTFEQGVFVLLKTLIGFQKIHEYVGYVHVQAKLIFFNQSGQVKVWMNEDLPVNHPRLGHSKATSVGQELLMVDQSLAAVQAHLVNPSPLAILKGMLSRMNPVTFQSAITALRQLIGQQRIEVPTRITLFANNPNRVQPDTIESRLNNQGLMIVGRSQNKTYVYQKSAQNASNQFGISVPLPNLALQRVRTQQDMPIHPHLQSKRHTYQSPKHHLLVSTSPNRNKSVIRNSPQSQSRISTINSRQTIQLPRNTSTSLSPRNPIKVVGPQKLSSPYFQYSQAPMLYQSPRKQIDISNVSRVSINSSLSRSSQRILSPNMRIVHLTANYPMSTGIVQLSMLTLKDADVDQPRQQNPKSTQYDGRNKSKPKCQPLLNAPQTIFKQQFGQSEQLVNKRSSKGKAIQWVKIVRKQNTPKPQPNNKYSSDSSRNSRIATEVPNSPMASNEFGHLEGLNNQIPYDAVIFSRLYNKLSTIDYGLQVDLPTPEVQQMRSVHNDKDAPKTPREHLKQSEKQLIRKGTPQTYSGKMAAPSRTQKPRPEQGLQRQKSPQLCTEKLDQSL